MLEVLSAEVGIVRPIRLTASPALASPVALGSSEIAIPEAALTDLDPDQQRGMLAHELAHLERRDPAWLTAACLVERIAFFQPLNRLARRRMQESAEYLCDEWAVRRTGSGVFLAKCLAKVAEWMDASPRAVPVAGMAEERSHLVARVRRLLDTTPFPSAPGRRMLASASAVAVLIAVVAVPGVSLARHQSDPADPGQGANHAQPEHDENVDRAGSLSQDSTRAVIRALLEAVRDPDLEVRRAAIRSLGRYEDPSTAPAFREALRDPDPEIRAIAIEALAEFKDRSSVGAIAAALRDENVEVRRAAADALDDLPAASARTELIAALRDPDAEVRERAISALARLKDPAATDALIAAMKDPKPDVRARAIEALHELELPTPPAALLDALRDPSAEVRQQAAHAVGHYQDARAVPTLRTMIEDPNAEVREAAVEALSEIRTEAAIEGLMSALKSKDPKVRRAAADALGQR
jgi:HEAT repeat protein